MAAALPALGAGVDTVGRRLGGHARAAATATPPSTAAWPAR